MASRGGAKRPDRQGRPVDESPDGPLWPDWPDSPALIGEWSTPKTAISAASASLILTANSCKPRRTALQSGAMPPACRVIRASARLFSASVGKSVPGFDSYAHEANKAPCTLAKALPLCRWRPVRGGCAALSGSVARRGRSSPASPSRCAGAWHCAHRRVTAPAERAGPSRATCSSPMRRTGTRGSGCRTCPSVLPRRTRGRWGRLRIQGQYTGACKLP